MKKLYIGTAILSATLSANLSAHENIVINSQAEPAFYALDPGCSGHTPRKPYYFGPGSHLEFCSPSDMRAIPDNASGLESNIVIGNGSHIYSPYESGWGVGSRLNTLVGTDSVISESIERHGSRENTGLGGGVRIYGNGNSAVGVGARVNGNNNIAIGLSAAAGLDMDGLFAVELNRSVGAIAIGANAVALADGSIAFGANSYADEVGVVSFGNSTERRRLINISDGVGDHDAVNFGQMNRITSAMSDRISNLESSGSGFDPSALYEYVNAAESRANSYAQSVASGVEQRVYQEVESSEARANSYADNAASAAEGRANTYTDAAVNGLGAGGPPAGDLDSAYSYTDQEVAAVEQRANSYADNAASAAEGRANTYTDSAVAGVEDRAVDRAATYTNTVVAGVEDRAVGRANSYTDERSAETLAAANAYTDAQVGGAIEQSNAYTDRKIASLEDKLSAGIAAIAAQPQLPALRVGQRAVAVGTGHYNGRNAVGVAFGFAPTDQITVGGGVSGSDRGKPVFKTSASYVW